MSVGYTAIQWSRHKRIYDGCVIGGIALYCTVFVAVAKFVWRGPNSISDEVLAIRALGSCAFVLLHIILCIGPLARLDRRFLPLLSNRRHLGVITFLVALAHGAIAVGYYHGFGVVHPFLSLLTSNTRLASFREFPFELLGLVALAILYIMAATSHDFWLKNLSSRAWKRLHMLVYLAYALLVAHVALGALQTSRGPLAPIMLLLGLVLVCTLHLAAALRERSRDKGDPIETLDGGAWIDAGPAAEIPNNRARTVCAPGGQRIAIFRHAGGYSAVSNVCAHQGGPLGEGKIIDGCITCPWHGWQYKPSDGCSPPPFKEQIATYQVRVVRGNIHVLREPSHPKPTPS